MNDSLSTPSFSDNAEPHVIAVCTQTRDCRVCLGPHDDEIHAATLAVRKWFREEVTKGFQPVVLF
ncbi:MAG: hypothetical protein C5B51_17105 [Terriglobia bacterium]|nr:MAG: hypothetical protein C5B51_17105 [Terriglobia bacterium]